MKKILAGIGILAALVLAGCAGYGEANNYNARSAKHTEYPVWTRIGSPANYETLIWACIGKDAIFIGQSTGITVSTYDPNCGASTQIVGGP